MFGPNGVRRFALRLLLLYGLLMFAWPGIENPYAVCFRACGNQLFGSFGSQGLVLYRPVSTEGSLWDTAVVVKNRQLGRRLQIDCNSRYTGYLPTAMVVALVLATPTPWSRRWRALLWAFVLVNGFVALRMAMSLVWVFRELSLYVFPPSWNSAVDVTYAIVSKSPVTSCVVAALIWVLVSFRGSDLRRTLPSPATRRVKP